MKILIFSVLVLASMSAVAQNERADSEFCKYTNEQAMAQRDQLRTPQAVIGPIQPSTGTPPQFVIGLSNSLSDDKKALLTMKVAQQTCALYVATSEAQMHLLYAIPSIEKEILANRLRLIDDATSQLNQLIAENSKLLDSHNLTVTAVYMLSSAKVRLDESRTTALTGIASPYVPKLSETPIRELVPDKLAHDRETMKAMTNLNRQSTWDIQLSVGAHRRLPSNISDVGTNAWGAYGAFNLNYNLGRHAVASHLEKSVDAYVAWRKSQFDDVAMQAVVLKRQMEDTVTAQKPQLEAMLQHDADITQQLKALEGLDTNNAIAFRNQLLADQIMLRVNIQDEQFCITRFEQFIAANF